MSIKLDSHLLISASPAARIEFLQTIAQICVEFNVEGHRANIMIERTARTNAAFGGVHVLTVDIDNHGSKLAREISQKTKGRYFHPESLSKDSLCNAISNERDDVSYFAKM